MVLLFRAHHSPLRDTVGILLFLARS
jgi:hypothetical protein